MTCKPGYEHVRWVRPNAKHHPIRVHYVPRGGSLTLCGVLDIKKSPYINVPGHAAVVTSDAVDCAHCLRITD